MEWFLKKLPIDISNKIIDYAISINISQNKNKMMNVHSQLFNGYWIECINNIMILKTIYNYEFLGNNNIYILGNKLLNKNIEIPKKFINKILPYNYLNYIDNNISSIELKDIEYEWIIRIPKLTYY